MATILNHSGSNHQTTQNRISQIRNGILVWAMVLSMHAHAQTGKGKVLLGGSLGITSSAERDKLANGQTLKQNGRGFSVNPGIGFFVADGWALGIDLGYESFFSESTALGSSASTIEQTNRVFSVSPFARYYRMLGDRISFFGQATVGSLSSGTNETTPATSTQGGKTIFTGYQVGLGITPGVTYFISPKVGIEASLGLLSYFYDRFETKLEAQGFAQPQTSTRSSNAFNFSFDLSTFRIGAKVYLGK
ncbi:MAG: outer membrane beta-barrel protein [Ferruginibacter sp.]|nr:outer membrane beta-barrel protein [Cytophagales bacterium]